jgi:hypothetical protein
VQDAQGNCAGTCDGNCQGTCELEAGGSCSGSCEGKCEYTAPSGGCSGGAEVKCEASASGSVDCQGTCEGNVTPPSAKAECEASAKADASVSATCSPPSLSLDFQLKAELQGAAGATARAEFIGWLDGFKGNISAILAFKTKLDNLVKVGGEVVAAAEGAVTGSINAAASGDVNLKLAAGLACALEQIPVAVTVMTDAAADLEASGTATVTVLGSVGL